MYTIIIAVVLLCLSGPAATKSGSAAPDLLREAEELKPYICDVRR